MLEQKYCPSCNELLDLNRFKKSKRNDRIYRSKICQRCLNAKNKKYRNEYYKAKRAANPGYDKKYKDKYRSSKAGKIKIKQYFIANRDKYIQANIEWFKNNKERRRISTKEWIENNPEKYKALYTKANKKRQDDPLLNFSMRIRCAVKKSFRKTFLPKRKRTFEYLGYSNLDLFNHLKEYIDKLCVVCKVVSITLKNSNIDHIIPVCIAKSKEDIIALNQLANLRLICKECNTKKISSDLKMKEESNVRLESINSKDRESSKTS